MPNPFGRRIQQSSGNPFRRSFISDDPEDRFARRFAGTGAIPTESITEFTGPPSGDPGNEDPGFGRFAIGSVKRSIVTPATGILETFGLLREGMTGEQKEEFEDLQRRYLEGSPTTQRFLASLFTRLGADAVPFIAGGVATKISTKGAQLVAKLGAGAKAQQFTAGAAPGIVEGGLLGLGETADAPDIGTRIFGTFLGMSVGGTAGGLVRATSGRLKTDPLDPETPALIRFWHREMTSKGMAPREVAKAIDNRLRVGNQAVFDVGTRAGELNELSAAYKIDKRMSEEAGLAFDEYLNREIDRPIAKQSFVGIDREQREAFRLMGRKMRGTINENTKRMENAGVVGPEGNDLRTVLEQGRSVTHDQNYQARVFKAFGDDGREWIDVVGEATYWSKTRKGMRHVFTDAKTHVEDELSRSGIEATDDEVINFMHTIVTKGRDENVWRKMGGEISKPFRDLFLKKNQDIPEPILALLGEKRSPAERYYATAIRQVQAIESFKLVQMVKEVGEGKLFWRSAQEAMPGKPFEAKTLPRLAEPGFVRTLEDGSREVLQRADIGPFYTTPEIHEVLFGSELSKAPSALQFANAFAKQMKTVWSFQTQARNFLANPLLVLMNGHLPYRVGTKGLMTWRFKGKAPKAAADREFISEAIRHGVVGDNVHVGDLDFYEQNMLAFLEAKDTGTRRFFNKKFRKLFNGKVQRYVKGGYQIGDEYWKVVLWRQEIDQLRWARPDKALPEIKAEAAEIVRNQMPTYSQVPKGIQRLRRNPLVGTFVSFPAEIFRNFKNVTKRGLYETFGNHGNTRLRAIGTKRLGGVWAALALPGGMAQYLRGPGATKEHEEAVKPLVAPWNRASQLVIRKLDDESFTYFDTSFLDPLSYLKRPFLAALGSKYLDEEGLGEVWREFSDTFIGPELATTAVLEVLMNKKGVPLLTGREGGTVWTPKSAPSEKFKKGFDRFRRGLQPGSVNTIERIARGAAGTKLGMDAGLNEILKPFNRYGTEYKLGTESLALIGPRLTTVNKATSVKFRAQALVRAKENARRIWGVERGNRTTTPHRLQRARTNAQEVWAEAFEEMQSVVDAARALGMTDPQLFQVLTRKAQQGGAGIPKTDARRLLMGSGPTRLRLR